MDLFNSHPTGTFTSCHHDDPQDECYLSSSSASCPPCSSIGELETVIIPVDKKNNNKSKLKQFWMKWRIIPLLVIGTLVFATLIEYNPEKNSSSTTDGSLLSFLYKQQQQHRGLLTFRNHRGRARIGDPRTIQMKVSDSEGSSRSIQNNNLQCVSTNAPLVDYTEFYGHTIYMLGDSLMRQQFQELCMQFLGFPFDDPIKKTWDIKYKLSPINPSAPLNNQIYVCQSPSSSHGEGSNNNNFVRAVYHKNAFPMASFAQYVQQELEIYYSSLQKNSNTPQPQILPDVKPSIIYFNAGFHLLHLYPDIRNWHWQNARDIEMNVIHFVQEINEIYKDTRIIYMKSHSICEERYTDGWADAVYKFHNDPLVFAAPCVKMLQKETKLQVKDASDPTTTTVIPHNVAVKSCLDASFTDHGSNVMNQRIERALSFAMEEFHMSRNKIGCVDGYEITRNRCQDTVDGRHYKARAPHELKGLSIVLQQQQRLL